MSDENGGDDGGKKKRVTIIAVSSLVLVAMVVGVAVGVNNYSSSPNETPAAPTTEISSSMKSIKAICEPTDFKENCVESLSSAAGNTTDPKELVKVAFKVAIKNIKQALNKSEVLHELEKDNFTAQALEDCKELMDYAIDDLKHSFDEVSALDMSKLDDLLVNLKIWLSAAITYQETCLDGFKNTTGNAAESMRKALKSSSELTRNGLAIVGEIASVLTSLQIPFSRRLLSKEQENFPQRTEDGFPVWVSASRRRLLAVPKSQLQPNVIVAQDGSGKYKTINEALKDAIRPKTDKTNTTFVIYVKAGVYKETVHFLKSMSYVMLVGDGPLKTKITGNRNFIDGTPTFKTATVAVMGDGFIAKDIGFENSAGAAKHQAVALRVSSDMSMFQNCQIDGYQDTLYAHAHRQFYTGCTISGTIDFIFGDAAVVFQSCKMVVRKPLDNQQNIVTAQGRKDQREPTGIVLQDCTITADPLLVPFMAKNPSFLGRPWKEFSRTIIMNTQIENVIQPEGWLPWMGDFALNTLYYAEFNNKGPGAALTKRVKWTGIKTPLTTQQALEYTPSRFLQGDQWIKPTGVPYKSGL
ncbi:probable pectinesterase/pectinesterase inhibitor 21 [Telopea speciosissima]|uniref:probable pectinesterase/pectinesterase inhibitor 21 n=1 Tax=Telopea speciosissima TaxID=54955 RepID=UPI001CC4B592|nr:probable pectinesterase/pectinesterase inhibitor 21 [Telopea speciosissima]